MLKTSILLITFNRPNHTRLVLERILGANPLELYVFQDGAREGNEHDIVKCAEVRKVIEELCNQHKKNTGYKLPVTNIHYYYSDSNLGCGEGPMRGISWFFENVEQGIVMEDDCLAHPDFFPYCEDLLIRYKNTDVKFINSTLYDDRWHRELMQENEDVSYEYSHYMCTGAWASYREVWQGFDLDLKRLNTCSLFRCICNLTCNMAEAEWWVYQLEAIKKDSGKKSYWDYQMQIHLFRQNAVTVHPCANLISNIGFDIEGTHTTSNDGRGNQKIFSIMPLKHPKKVEVDTARDMRCWAKKQSRGALKDIIFIIYHIWAWRKKKKFVQ